MTRSSASTGTAARRLLTAADAARLAQESKDFQVKLDRQARARRARRRLLTTGRKTPLAILDPVQPPPDTRTMGQKVADEESRRAKKRQDRLREEATPKRVCVSTTYVLGADDVTHLLRDPAWSTALCSDFVKEIWWNDDWQPDNYPMCQWCAGLQYQLKLKTKKRELVRDPMSLRPLQGSFESGKRR